MEFSFDDRFSWRQCIPLVHLFWLPALAFSECQQGSFFPVYLLTHSGWAGRRRHLQGQSLTLDESAPGLSRRCREVEADQLPTWFRVQGLLSPLNLCRRLLIHVLEVSCPRLEKMCGCTRELVGAVPYVRELQSVVRLAQHPALCS